MEKVLLKNNNGKVKNGLKIRISRILFNTSEKIWEKLINVETLIEICKPMARFKLISKENEVKWETSKEYIFKLYIYGFIPFGKHKIFLEKVDKGNKIIQSKECNKIVSIWDHKIIMEQNGENTIEYTDEVDIYAGIITIFVALWAKMFYKHRQRKWEKISKIL